MKTCLKTVSISLSFFLFLFNIARGQEIPLSYDDLSICSFFNDLLPHRVAFKNSKSYATQLNSYWAVNQGSLHSTCRITPHSVTDLQDIFPIIARAAVPFALKSGGHSVVANTSNVEHGIVIDLESLNHISVHKEVGYIDIGVGARWNDVYAVLDGTGFGVTGARAGSVGVGGYLLGGGLSIYQGTQGWACDSALMYEVVLANGTVLETSRQQHADLFRALKGSATNFGIVTRVRLRLVPDSADIDVVVLSYGIEQLSEVVDAVMRYNVDAELEPLATAAVSVGGTTNGPYLGISVLMTHPVSVAASQVLKHFCSIPHTVGTQTRMSQRAMATLYDEMNPKGFRQFRSTTTLGHGANIFSSVDHDLVDLFIELIGLNDTNIRCGLLIQPLTLPHLRAGKATNGNILGLENQDTPLLLVSFELRYSKVQDSDTIMALGSQFMTKLEDAAGARKQLHPYRYLNYASAGQDVFAHARADADLWAWLLKVKSSYDPHNVFGKQMLHPFKIGS